MSARHGKPKSAFEPGADIRAKVTIFAEGVRGNLTKELTRTLQLDDEDRAAAICHRAEGAVGGAAGRLEPGTVSTRSAIRSARRSSAAASLYAMAEERISIGFVVGLDYQDPLFDPHAAFQRFKLHPFIKGILDGGHMLRYGAKALPEGGWSTQPRLFMDGGLIVGDSANFVNSLRLKGIHLAMRSGMLAAETAFDAVRAGDTSAASLSQYKTLVDESAIKAELYPVRNVHQAFENGLIAGLRFAGLAMMTGGRWIEDCHGHPGHKRMKTIADYYGLEKRDMLTASNAVAPDRKSRSTR